MIGRRSRSVPAAGARDVEATFGVSDGTYLAVFLFAARLQAHRGQIHEDPIVASARDPASYIVAALVALALYAAL